MAELAMETSKVEPADRDQAKSKLNRVAYVDSFPYVESYVDSNPYVESSVDSDAYVESSIQAHCFSSEEKMRSAKEKINQTLHEEKMKQLVRKDVNNSGVESAVEEVNEPDVVVQLLTYQMLINRGESAVGTTNSKTADEI
ncbi:SET domain protein [Dorcoceras hygrometricum]|uniref:SET domain protein n=1 Tax=Dorcoceras hygrometricum TaxID=472368 RepID=A0A2Z7CTH0_9LAMI|nr:SET domain protein [Dorcoceras hygrometricum]